MCVENPQYLASEFEDPKYLERNVHSILEGTLRRARKVVERARRREDEARRRDSDDTSALVVAFAWAYDSGSSYSSCDSGSSCSGGGE